MVLRRLIVCCTLLCAAAAHAAAATAATAAAGASLPAPHRACGELKLAFYEHGSLYYRGADGLWAGIDKDVVDELARRTGCRFQTFTDSRVRIWAMINGGTLAMSTSAIANPERGKYARFVPYMQNHNYVLLHEDAPARLRSLDDFLAEPGYKIAVIKSFRHGPIYDAWLDKLRAQGRVYETPDYSSLLRLFKLGRVQAMLSLSTSWKPLAGREQSMGRFRAMDWAPRETIVSSLVLSRQLVSAETAEQFALAIRAMSEDGTLKRILERHVGAGQTPSLLNLPLPPATRW
jgi:polar amino acid transport system substrate-binding protein